MEFANDLMTVLRGGPQTGSTAAGPQGLCDWPGLHARLSAAHALRQELASNDSRGTVRDGAFSDWALPASGRPKQTRGVNLKDSTDRKAPLRMDDGTAGQVHASGREQ